MSGDDLKNKDYVSLMHESQQCLKNLIFQSIEKKEVPDPKSQEYLKCLEIIHQSKTQILEQLESKLSLDSKQKTEIQQEIGKNNISKDK